MLNVGHTLIETQSTVAQLIDKHFDSFVIGKSDSLSARLANRNNHYLISRFVIDNFD